MRSFALHFTAVCTGANAGGRLPDDISTLIDRVEVSCGGVQLSAGANYYNVLKAAKRALADYPCDPVLSHSEVVREKSYVNNSVIATNDPETYPVTESLFCIDKWEGFLGSCEPKIMDSSLVPDIVVSIYVSDTNVLSSVAGVGKDGFAGALTTDGSGAASFSLSNIHATIECLGLQDAMYDNLVAGMIASKGFLEVPFKQYFAFQDTHSGAMRFSVATQSLDRIWAVQRDTDFGNQVAPKRVAGFKTIKQGDFVGTIAVANAAIAVNDVTFNFDTADGITKPLVNQFINNAAKTLFPAGTRITAINVGEITVSNKALIAAAVGVTLDLFSADFEPEYSGLEYDKEKYISTFNNFPEAAAGATYQFQLNGAYFPQFRASFEEMHQISRNSLLARPRSDVGLHTMKTNYAVQCIRLNLPESEFSRLVSGLNTRQVSLNGYYNIYNLGTTTPTVNLFCEATSTLKIGAAKQLEVVQ